MKKVIFNASMSLDGFIAAPNDDCSLLHSWYFSGDTELPGTPFKISKASAELMTKAASSIGAMVTGRRNYNISNAWNGYPPLGVHHFVVTHSPDKEWVKEGSPFTFIMSGVENAIADAKKLAGEKNVCISSANILQQAFEAGLVDEIYIDLIPVLLGDGIPLWVQSSHKELELLSVVNGIGVTHLGYKIIK